MITGNYMEKRQMVIGALGMMAASAGAGVLQDIWQKELNRKSQDQATEYSKELMDFQQKKQLEMWEKTGYSAQMKQMRGAGLNPALMYGMSGGGGQTTGNAGASVGAMGIQSKAGESAMMGLQIGLIEAQRKKAEADAAKAEAETAKTKGVDTEKAGAEVDSIRQGIDNERWKNELLKIEKAMMEIDRYEKQASQEDRLDYIEYQTKIAERQLKIISNDEQVSSATIKDKIKLIHAEAIGAIIRNRAAEAGISLTHAQIQNMKEQIQINWKGLIQNWTKLDQEQQKINIEKMVAELSKTWPGVQQVTGKVLADLLKYMNGVGGMLQIPKGAE